MRPDKEKKDPALFFAGVTDALAEFEFEPSQILGLAELPSGPVIVAFGIAAKFPRWSGCPTSITPANVDSRTARR